MIIGRDNNGQICFFMGGGDVVEHHCIVTNAMIKMWTKKSLKPHCSIAAKAYRRMMIEIWRERDE